MINKIRNDRSAFTLVEIMIVVAIIGLLAALAVPGFVKARKQSQGRRILISRNTRPRTTKTVAPKLSVRLTTQPRARR